jgi:hypothetical protein
MCSAMFKLRTSWFLAKANIYSLLNLSDSSVVGVLCGNPKSNNQTNLAFYICINVRETVECVLSGSSKMFHKSSQTFFSVWKSNVEELWCDCKLYVQNFFPDQRSPPSPCDYLRLLAFTQRSSCAIPATIGDYRCFHKCHRTLTKTSSCDGSLKRRWNHRSSQTWVNFYTPEQEKAMVGKNHITELHHHRRLSI